MKSEATERFKCEKCPFESAKKGQLNRHTRYVHAKIKKHNCEACKSAFSHRYELKNHIACVHLKAKKFCCEKCSYESFDSRNIERHIKSVHDKIKIKDHVCEECSKTFSRKITLKDQNIRKYKCPQCPKAFKQRNNVVSHLSCAQKYQGQEVPAMQHHFFFE